MDTTSDMADEHTLQERIGGLTVFLEAFGASGQTFGAMEIKPGVMPYFVFSEVAMAFTKAAYDFGWVIVFDWPAWDDGKRFVEDPAALAQADVADIERLLTAHIRQDRFCDGHLAAMFDCGHLTAILRRLQDIGRSAPADDR